MLGLWLFVMVFGFLCFVAVQINAHVDYSGDHFDGISSLFAVIAFVGLVGTLVSIVGL